MDNNRVPSSSPDLTQANIEKMKELFPEIITEGKVDFDMLKTVLGEEIDDRNERYKFEWHGKKESLLGSQQPSKGTLRPDKGASKNFDTTENLYIEGDNLEVLKLLQKSYNGKVKMIFIDPPYNTGTDLIYKNNFHDDIEQYLSYTNQKVNGNLFSTNKETEGKIHTNWLNMIYSRIKLSRNLLKDNGVFVITIDHYELANLVKVCDEIFGEDNRIGIISVVHKPEGRNQARHFGPSNEYALFYCKNKSEFDFYKAVLDEEEKKRYEFKDQTGLYRKKNFIRLSDGKYSLKENKPDFYYPIYVSQDLKELSTTPLDNSEKIYPITVTGVERTWKTTKKTCQERINNNNLMAEIENEKIVIYEKLREDQVLKTHWIDKKYHAYHFGTKLLDNLLGAKTFDFPKSLYLIIDLLKISLGKNELVLDFFSGSATTAHATMKLNAEDGGNRKFIMVQLPEVIKQGSEAHKAGYRTISEVGQDRIHRAGQKIIEEHPKATEYLDIGFKVLKLDASNIREWNVDFEELEGQITSYDNMFVPSRSELDVVYEIMLKYGLELTYPINSFQVNDKNIYDIAFGNLFICLDEQIDTTIAQAIINKRNEYGIETSSVVFADHGFHGNDSEKLNCFKLLEDAGYQNEQLMTI